MQHVHTEDQLNALAYATLTDEQWARYKEHMEKAYSMELAEQEYYDRRTLQFLKVFGPIFIFFVVMIILASIMGILR